MSDAPEITTMGEKGQVVIPKRLRDDLGISPKTKFIVVGMGDTILLKRLRLPDVAQEFEELFARMDRKGLALTETDVGKEVAAHRKKRRR